MCPVPLAVSRTSVLYPHHLDKFFILAGTLRPKEAIFFRFEVCSIFGLLQTRPKPFLFDLGIPFFKVLRRHTILRIPGPGFLAAWCLGGVGALAEAAMEIAAATLTSAGRPESAACLEVPAACAWLSLALRAVSAPSSKEKLSASSRPCSAAILSAIIARQGNPNPSRLVLDCTYE